MTKPIKPAAQGGATILSPSFLAGDEGEKSCPYGRVTDSFLESENVSVLDKERRPKEHFDHFSRIEQDEFKIRKLEESVSFQDQEGVPDEMLPPRASKQLLTEDMRVESTISSSSVSCDSSKSDLEESKTTKNDDKEAEIESDEPQTSKSIMKNG